MELEVREHAAPACGSEEQGHGAAILKPMPHEDRQGAPEGRPLGRVEEAQLLEPRLHGAEDVCGRLDGEVRGGLDSQADALAPTLPVQLLFLKFCGPIIGLAFLDHTLLARSREQLHLILNIVALERQGGEEAGLFIGIHSECNLVQFQLDFVAAARVQVQAPLEHILPDLVLWVFHVAVRGFQGHRQVVDQAQAARDDDLQTARELPQQPDVHGTAQVHWVALSILKLNDAAIQQGAHLLLAVRRPEVEAANLSQRLLRQQQSPQLPSGDAHMQAVRQLGVARGNHPRQRQQLQTPRLYLACLEVARHLLSGLVVINLAVFHNSGKVQRKRLPQALALGCAGDSAES
mmetsp:Transcript_107568/g.343187  ORF Transcript_107568/g.343187 Transcript_107568/m.343187 type:complete len:348 (-) Transcript_107568:354-1397(-)